MDVREGLLLLLAVVSIGHVVVSAREYGPTVLHSIEDGGLTGFIRYTNDDYSSPIFTFLGVPFAAPPTGQLRFRPPQPVQPWRGIKDATNLAPECPQDPIAWTYLESFGYIAERESTISEDCLNLNIYTPTLNKRAELPVMVYIHGGELSMGSGRLVDGTALASMGDIVAVSINYRLAVLGFLTTFDEEAPGNLGFRDQTMALRWIQENIADFGGDPRKVMIYGESAGSLSVVGQILSPMSEGLFARAIGQSGTIDDTMTRDKDSGINQNSVNKLAHKLGCESEETSEILACLRDKPAMDLVMPPGDSTPDPELLFLPIYGDDFFPEKPSELLKRPDIKQRISKLDIVMGVTQNEGYMLSSIMMDGFSQNQTVENLFESMKGLLIMLNQAEETSWEKIEQALQDHYLPMQDPTGEDLTKAGQSIVGDSIIIAATIQKLNEFTELGANTYGYELALGPSYLRDVRPADVLSDHGDDLAFVFGGSKLGEAGLGIARFSRSYSPMTKEDLTMENLMMNYWLNFARTGNPNSEGLPEWPHYTHAQKVLSMNLKSTVKDNYSTDTTKLWAETIPDIRKSVKREKL